MAFSKFTDNAETAVLLGDLETDRNGGVIASGYVNMALYDLVVFLLPNGGLGADIDWTIRQATQDADGGGDVVAIAGKTATATNGTDENTMQVIEVRTGELNVDGGFQWLQAYAADPGGALTYAGVIALGFNARYARATMPDMEVAASTA